jgi:hypothetical protein
MKFTYFAVRVKGREVPLRVCLNFVKYKEIGNSNDNNEVGY